jgi:hypothetical protein
MRGSINNWLIVDDCWEGMGAFELEGSYLESAVAKLRLSFFCYTK